MVMYIYAKENIKHGYHIGIVEETHDEPNIAIDFTIEDGNIHNKFQIDRCKMKVDFRYAPSYPEM